MGSISAWRNKTGNWEMSHMTRTKAQTRSELIDQQLALSGWNVMDPTQVVEEFDILTNMHQGVAQPRALYEHHQFSDYVLLDEAARADDKRLRHRCKPCKNDGFAPSPSH